MTMMLAAPCRKAMSFSEKSPSDLLSTSRTPKGTPSPCNMTEGLEAEFCKILEYIPSEKRLLMRAGVGWDAGVVGKASVGADLESPAGFALHTGKPVICNQLENEQRSRTSEL